MLLISSVGKLSIWIIDSLLSLLFMLSGLEVELSELLSSSLLKGWYSISLEILTIFLSPVFKSGDFPVLVVAKFKFRGSINIFFSSTREFLKEFGIVEVKFEGDILWSNRGFEPVFFKLCLTESLNYPIFCIFSGEQYWILKVFSSPMEIRLDGIIYLAVYLGETRWLTFLVMTGLR